MTDALPVFIGPEPLPWLCDAVVRGGGRQTPLSDAQAVVWFGFPYNFPALPSGVHWVQLPFAGIEPWLEAGLLPVEAGDAGAPGEGRLWTNGSGVYAETVAEHALTMLLSGVRGLTTAAGRATWSPEEVGPAVGTLRGTTVGIVGAGGIGRALIPMIRALGAEIIAINRSGRPVQIDGQQPIEAIPVDLLDDTLPRCDHLVLSAPGTEATRNLLGAKQLALLRPHSWIVNVGRGTLIDTDALTRALSRGDLGGAGLDVTEPEPLPDGHPLWGLPNVLVTPHVANPPQQIPALLSVRIEENVRRFREGHELIGVINPQLGY